MVMQIVGYKSNDCLSVLHIWSYVLHRFLRPQTLILCINDSFTYIQTIYDLRHVKNTPIQRHLVVCYTAQQKLVCLFVYTILNFKTLLLELAQIKKTPG